MVFTAIDLKPLYVMVIVSDDESPWLDFGYKSAKITICCFIRMVVVDEHPIERLIFYNMAAASLPVMRWIMTRPESISSANRHNISSYFLSPDLHITRSNRLPSFV